MKNFIFLILFAFTLSGCSYTPTEKMDGLHRMMMAAKTPVERERYAKIYGYKSYRDFEIKRAKAKIEEIKKMPTVSNKKYAQSQKRKNGTISRDRVGGAILSSRKTQTLGERRAKRAAEKKALIANDEKIKKIDGTIAVLKEKMRGAGSQRNRYLFAIKKLENDRRKRVKKLTRPSDSYGLKDAWVELQASYPPEVFQVIEEAGKEAAKRMLTGGRKKGK